MASETVTVTICDVDLVVSYDYTPYRPATRWEPAEGGDVEITAIRIGHDNVDGLLGGWVMDKLYEAVDKDIKERRRDVAEDKSMARAA